MTAVEELRRAAALMRERAQAATPGPWLVDRSGLRGYGKNTVVDVAGEYLHGVAVCGEGDTATRDAEHVASWSPPVALAVADWLDAEAVLLDGLAPFTELLNVAYKLEGGTDAFLRLGRNEDGTVAMRGDSSQGALAVARAYLGGQP